MPKTHKRTFAARGPLALLAGCCLSLSLLGTPLRVQAQDTGESEKAKGESNAQSSIDNSQSPGDNNLPVLLLVVQRPQGTAARREDVNSALSLMLRSSVRESRKYQVILYSPEHPSIRRALLEHSIAASDLVEPIKPESLQKLAHLLGAHNILMVSSAQDKVGLKTDVRLMQDAGGDMWITPIAQPFTIDAQIGKLRLKLDQMLALTVDNIDGYIGVPSHLADNIHLKKTKLIGVPIASKDKNGKAKKGKTNKGDADPGTEGDTATDTTDTGDEQANGKSSADANKTDGNVKAGGTSQAGKSQAGKGTEGDPEVQNNGKKPDKVASRLSSKQTAKPPRNTQIAKNDPPHPTAPTSEPNPEKNPENGKGGEGTEPSPVNRNNVPRPNTGNSRTQPTILNTDAGASLLAEPNIVPPAATGDRIDLEAAADRYRKIGDLPNSIASLRQAINENPRDLHLRKKLIVAYQDRQLLDMAVSETERAMQLAPADSDLSRLYANSLIARGDTQGAIKLLRDIVMANPKDTAAQVSLGDALLADSQFADAMNAFESAAKNDSKSPLPHRRLARVFVARAGSDIKQYAACLAQIEQARSLTPATDTLTYQGDYFEMLLLVESRLKDMLDQVNETYGGVGKRANADLMQHATDLKERAEAASDFLDKLPPAAGQETTHAHYAQGAALLAQSIGYLRKYIQIGDSQLADSLRSTRIDALTEFTAAHARLMTARAALEKGRAATGVTTTN